MITALKQVEARRRVEDVAREVGVSKHTIYGWKDKHGGLAGWADAKAGLLINAVCSVPMTGSAGLQTAVKGT
jgi:hypothetical protein